MPQTPTMLKTMANVSIKLINLFVLLFIKAPPIRKNVYKNRIT